MQVNPVVQHVELQAQEYETEPLGSLFVTTPSYDRPYPPDPRYDLNDVRPAVVATSGKPTAATGLGPTGLRVGLLFITELDISQQSSPPAPSYTASAGLTSFVHQLAGGGHKEPGEHPDLFSGGTVRWGDGSSSNITDLTTYAQHTYAAAGTYDISFELHFAEAENLAWSGAPSATHRLTVS